MAYNVGRLFADVSAEADEHNSALLGPNTLGIEVTHRGLASRCGLGNIDPQHGQDGEKKSSAIQEALRWPLPPDGATLVTIKYDKDAIGAMAVLAIRREGNFHLINRSMVNWIGVTDFFGGITAVKKYTVLSSHFKNSLAMKAMNVIVHRRHLKLSLADRVCLVADILTGSLTQEEINFWAEQFIVYPRKDFTRFTTMYGEVGYVDIRSNYHLARNWGQKKFKVVLVRDKYVNRITLARQEGYFDKQRFDREVNILEANARGLSLEELEELNLDWGGTLNLTASPAGHGRETQLINEIHKIAQLAQECLESGVVT